jgi:membrane-associated protease RseP (regulator of RpoE activity)
MEFMTRGAAAALFTLGFVAPLGAQVAGAIQTRPREPRDSTELRAVMMSKARIDSMIVLMRELKQIPTGTPEFEAMRARIDALVPTLQNRVMIRANGLSGPSAPKGWIGLRPQGPSLINFGPEGYFVQYFDYPSIISVDPESPAKRAGIVPGDVLIAYDGVDVKGHRFDLTRMLIPDRKLSVEVRHDGEPKEYTLTVAPAPVQMYERQQLDAGAVGEIHLRVNAGDPPRGGGDTYLQGPFPPGGPGGGVRAGTIAPFRILLSPNGAFGAILSTVSPELARTLKLETGVLVNDVTDETPASTSGLRPGDVIVSVAGQSVATLKAFQEAVLMRKAERAVVLDVVRDKRPRKVTVSW